MKLTLPLVVLGFGDYRQTHKLLAVTNPQGATLLPVFTDPELAEAYRVGQNAKLRELTLPFAVGKVGYDEPPDSFQNPNQLNALVVAKKQHVADFLRLMGVAYGHFYVTLDPSPSAVGQLLCYEVDEFIALLEEEAPPASA